MVILKLFRIRNKKMAAVAPMRRKPDYLPNEPFLRHATNHTAGDISTNEMSPAGLSSNVRQRLIAITS